MNESSPSDAAPPGAGSATKPVGDVIAINVVMIKDYFGQVVVKAVEGP